MRIEETGLTEETGAQEAEEEEAEAEGVDGVAAHVNHALTEEKLGKLFILGLSKMKMGHSVLKPMCSMGLKIRPMITSQNCPQPKILK